MNPWRKIVPLLLLIWIALDVSAQQLPDREETWREVAFHDASEEAILAALPRLAERQSTQPFMTPLNLTDARFGSVPKTFIRSTADRILTTSLQDRMIANWPVERVENLDSGHFPTLSAPGDLARAML